MNRNLVGSIYMYGRLCIKFPQSRLKGERHRLSPLFFFFKSVIFLLKSVHLLVEYIKYRYLIPASLTLVKHITYKDVSIC